MTTASSPEAPPFVYHAAIAVLSRGCPLDAARLEALTRVLTAEIPDATLRESLLALARTGLKASAVERQVLSGAEEALRFLAALTLFALRQAPDEREALELPELFAAAQRLPYDAVPRLVAQISPESRLGRWEMLDNDLREYLHPPDEVLAIARRALATLELPRVPKRSAAAVPAEHFEHPLDRQGRDIVNGFAGFDELTRLIFEHGFEKIFRLFNLSSCVRVTPEQFPDLYRTYQACVQRAGVHPEPELYLSSGGLNAHTSGVERPYIMLGQGAVSMLTRDELEFVIGHELGHIRCQHLLHHFMASYLPRIAGLLPMVGPYLAFGLDAALGEWRRKAELTCDRMGLLVCQEPEAALRVMIKWSGVPGMYYNRIDIEAFLRQHEEFRELDRDMLSLLYKLLFSMGRSHPWTVERAAELKRWYDEGEYEAAFRSAAPTATPQALPMQPVSLPTPAAPLLPETVPVVAPPAPAAHLAEALLRLERLAARTAHGPMVSAGLDALREASEAATPLVVVVGEKGRGLWALADRLLGPLPALARPGVPVVVQAGSETRWVEDGPDHLTLESPATLLNHLRLLATHGLNDPDSPHETFTGEAVLSADAVVVCLSATQLLSAEERRVIRERILPLASGRLALAVSHMDALDTDEDRTDLERRLTRFLSTLDRDEVRVFYLPGGPGTPAPELEAFLRGAGGTADGRTRWLEKTQAFLGVLAGGWAEGAPPDDPEAARAATLAYLRDEHALALAAAESSLSARIAALRLELPGRVARHTPEAWQQDGVPALTQAVRQTGADAGRVYLATLERALLASAPAPLRQSVAGLAGSAGARLQQSVGGTLNAAWQAAPRPRHAGLMGMTAVGAGLLVFTGGLALPVVGAIALGTAHQFRRQLDTAFQDGQRQNAALMLDQWLTGVEAAMVEDLRTASAHVLEGLETRSLATLTRHDTTLAPADTAALRAAALEALTLCEAMLADKETSL